MGSCQNRGASRSPSPSHSFPSCERSISNFCFAWVCFGVFACLECFVKDPHLLPKLGLDAWKTHKQERLSGSFIPYPLTTPHQWMQSPFEWEERKGRKMINISKISSFHWVVRIHRTRPKCGVRQELNEWLYKVYYKSSKLYGKEFKNIDKGK